MGDPVYDAFYASQVQFQNNTVWLQAILSLPTACDILSED